MNPVIEITSEDQGILKFKISGIDTSLANAIRRIILSEIPTPVFRTTGENKKVTWITNTTRMNNELIGQRLSCVPIHIKDTNFPIENIRIEVDKKNEGDIIDFVTTGDFKIKDIKTDKYLTDSATRKIFPPNPLTGDFIDLCRLRPRISDDIAGEHLKFTCILDIGTAQQDNAFNVAATCSYGFTLDEGKIKKLYNEKKTELSKTEITKEDVEFALKDWSLLEAKRHFIQNSFDFVIETVGPFSNSAIVHKACDIMINKLKKFQNTMNNQQDLISNSNTTIVNGYDITIPNEGYTLGKVIEYVLYSKYYGTVLTYCGFQKPHPHIDICKIRLGFKDAIEISNIVTYLVDVADHAIKVYEKIIASFNLE